MHRIGILTPDRLEVRLAFCTVMLGGREYALTLPDEVTRWSEEDPEGFSAACQTATGNASLVYKMCVPTVGERPSFEDFCDSVTWAELRHAGRLLIEALERRVGLGGT